MPDYSQGKIYKVECNITNEVYYGSTVLSLSRRMRRHRNGKKCCTAINIINRGNYNVKVIEEYPCNSKQELEARERWYIENNVCINKCIPGRTEKEWREANKEHCKKVSKDWYENNKEHKTQQNKEWLEKNKDKMKEYRKEWREANKTRIHAKYKERYEANKELIRQQNKERYEANKDKREEKFNCGCGGKYTRSNIAVHCKTKNHQKYILSQYAGDKLKGIEKSPNGVE